MKVERKANFYSLQQECGHWFKADHSTPTGIVLLVHGLNQKPSTWSEITIFLNGLGLHVYRLSLKGHRGHALSDMHDVNSGIWEQDIFEGYIEIKARFPDVPVYLVGYSLGALVSMVVQLKRGESLFSKQVLLAPAISLKPYTRLALPLSHLFRYMPSRATEQYIANREGSTAEAYKALFQLERELHMFGNSSPVSGPTLVLMRRDDELVSYKKTLQFIVENDLKKWELIPLEDELITKRNSFSYKHLIVDQRSAGTEVWEKMLNQMKTFLTDVIIKE